MFDAFGTDTALGGVYAALVTHPHSTLAELVGTTAQPIEQVAAALEELQRSDLAAPDALAADPANPAWEAHPPDGAAADLLHNYERRLDLARNTHHQLTKMFWLARRSAAHYPGLEVIRDPALAQEQLRLLQTKATEQVRGFDRGPFLHSTDELKAEQVALQAQRMSEGIPYRVIYRSPDLAEHPTLMACVAAGEQARTLAELPLKMFMGDSRSAVLPLDPVGLIDGATLVVHPSALLTALEGIFETFWQLAQPIARPHPHQHPGDDDPVTPLQRDILALLAAGATDSQIATRLNLSRSTVVRSCATLFQLLGATTRFQAGIYAQRRGWLS